MILDGAVLTERLFGERLDPREHLVRMYPKVAVPPLDHVVQTASPLTARVNHGIWSASCPCGARGVPTPGAVVFFEVPLVWCLRCQNGGTGRGWRPVIVPVPTIRHQIEAVLLCRPIVEDRNWEPHETVDDLIAQNREHGDPVPDLHPRALGPELGPDWRSFVTPFSPFFKQARRRFGRLLGR